MPLKTARSCACFIRLHYANFTIIPHELTSFILSTFSNANTEKDKCKKEISRHPTEFDNFLRGVCVVPFHLRSTFLCFNKYFVFKSFHNSQLLKRNRSWYSKIQWVFYFNYHLCNFKDTYNLCDINILIIIWKNLHLNMSNYL